MTFGVFYDALDVCIKRYNDAKGTNYTKTDLVIGDPIDLRSWPTPHPSKKNTLVVATVGEVVIEFVYDRFDIQGKFLRELTTTAPAVYLWKTCVGTKDTLAELIQYHYAIPMTARDLVPEPFDPSTFNTDTTRTVKVTISGRSYNYLPKTSFHVGIAGRYLMVDGKPFLVNTSAVTGPSQWTEDFTYLTQDLKTRGQSAMVSWGTDYSKARRLLKRIPGSQVYYNYNCLGYYSQGGRAANFCTDLAKALTAIDGLPWTFDSSGSKPWNLYYAWPVYNGPTSEAKREKAMNYRVPTQFQHLLDACNPAFDNVLILYLAATYVSNLTSACLFLHFNDSEVV